ncbi:helix-turn-helix domain-containing protein [Megamonas funiformis]
MNLKKIRKERGFSQRYMADQLKIGISTYNQYENSNRKKSLISKTLCW